MKSHPVETLHLMAPFHICASLHPGQLFGLWKFNLKVKHISCNWCHLKFNILILMSKKLIFSLCCPQQLLVLPAVAYCHINGKNLTLHHHFQVLLHENFTTRSFPFDFLDVHSLLPKIIIIRYHIINTALHWGENCSLLHQKHPPHKNDPGIALDHQILNCFDLCWGESVINCFTWSHIFLQVATLAVFLCCNSECTCVAYWLKLVVPLVHLLHVLCTIWKTNINEFTHFHRFLVILNVFMIIRGPFVLHLVRGLEMVSFCKPG